jgi:hypothetical protein
MFTQIDWRTEISAVAGPFQGYREDWLLTAAQKSGTSFRQIKRLYYGECKDPKFSVAVGVLSAAEKARSEAEKLAAKFEMAAGILNADGKNKNRNDVLTLLSAASLLRGVDTPSSHSVNVATPEGKTA